MVLEDDDTSKKACPYNDISIEPELHIEFREEVTYINEVSF